MALISAAKKKGVRYSVGVTFSVDGFYSENKILGDNDELVSMSHGKYSLRMGSSRLDDVKAMGAKNIEMENATLFTLSSLFGLRAGAICIVSDVVPWHPTEKIIDFEKNIGDCISVAVEALSTLMKWDSEKGESQFWAP